MIYVIELCAFSNRRGVERMVFRKFKNYIFAAALLSVENRWSNTYFSKISPQICVFVCPFFFSIKKICFMKILHDFFNIYIFFLSKIVFF